MLSKNKNKIQSVCMRPSNHLQTSIYHMAESNTAFSSRVASNTVSAVKNDGQSMNTPNGKSSQTFFCKPWEAKHIAGVRFKKCDEFRSLPGISCIDCPRGSSKFVISGQPRAVDDVMRKMQTLIDEQATGELLARVDLCSFKEYGRPSDRLISSTKNV